jgi:hypothetical protein
MTVAETWEGEVGGFHSDTNVTVEFATFRTDDLYNNGKTLLLVLTMTDEADGSNFDHMLSIGGDWVTPDGGYTVAHTKGKTKFNKQSNVQKWIDACRACPGFEELRVDRGLAAQDARFWSQMRFHLIGVDDPYTINGEKHERTTIIPDAFLGVRAEATTIAVPPQQVPLQPQNATPTLKTPDQLRAEAAARQQQTQDPHANILIELAKRYGTHNEFFNAACVNDWVLADDDLLIMLQDPAQFYNLHHA